METSPGEQLRNELRAAIHRAGQESDITIAETLGVIELIKAEFLDQIRNTPNGRP